jgi:hypothetical protein
MLERDYSNVYPNINVTRAMSEEMKQRAARGEVEIDRSQYGPRAPFVEEFARGVGGTDDLWSGADVLRHKIAQREAARKQSGTYKEYPIEDRVPRHAAGGMPIDYGRDLPPENEPRKWGGASSYPERYGRVDTDNMSPTMKARVEADMDWKEEYEPRPQPGTEQFTAEEWDQLKEFGYEPTKSPLILRKRNPNGTVTYVHSADLRRKPQWKGEGYGLNNEYGQGPDPFWREGRRDW